MYHHWGRTSIYRPLSYPFRSLVKHTHTHTHTHTHDCMEVSSMNHKETAFNNKELPLTF